MRRGIETAFRDIKYTIGLINLHSKKEDLVMQEIYAALIMYNFSTRITGAVVVQKKEPTIHAYQVNFKMAVMLRQCAPADRASKNCDTKGLSA